MKILRVLNNNAAVVVTDENKEAIVLGSGVSFGKKPQDEVRKTSVEKIFYMSNRQNQQKLAELLEEIPNVYFNLADQIIHAVQDDLRVEVNEMMYLILTDHIYYAIKRYYQNQMIVNSMYWELKHFYPREFEVGVKALDMINHTFNVYLPEYEAGFIVMHILNMTGDSHQLTIKDEVTDLKAITDIAKYHFGKELDEKSMNYLRFITHIRFFLQRVNKQEELNKISAQDDLFQLVCQKYFNTYLCVEKIEKYIQSKYQCDLSDEEKLYLVLHINRLFINT